jgi:hypothetical protein
VSIDFLCVLIGYALSGEGTLKGFYERLTPFATPFMALFGRSELPSRAALSRFLAAIDQPAVEALRALFQKDLVARPLTEGGKSTGGLWDRCGEQWLVFDVRAAHDKRHGNGPCLQRQTCHQPIADWMPISCSWIYRAQTGRSCSHAYHDSASAYPSVDGNIR